MSQIKTFLKPLTRGTTRNLLLYYGIFAAWLFTTAMHIPDGYLSPVTSVIMFLIILPFWVMGVRKLAREDDRQECAIDRPDRGFLLHHHDVQRANTRRYDCPRSRGALAAIILGPEIATMAISIALVIQAFFFGDGGILALGANCFNMAVVLPYVSYAIYQAISKNQPVTSKRRIVGAAVGAGPD